MADVPAPRPDRTPAVGRAALDRVLARAAELQVQVGDDAEGALSEAQLIELGKEAGLSPEHLRQALAEERSRVHVVEERGWLASITGPGSVSASRTIRGRPADLLAALDAWMDKEECQRVRRRFPDRITWEPRQDLRAQMVRGLNGRGRTLSCTTEVAATAVPIDEQRTIVRIDADVSARRQSRLRVGGLTAGVTVAAGGAIGTMAVVAHAAAIAVAGVMALPVAAGVGAAYMLARGHRATAQRAQLAIEQLLDRLEHGELRAKPPSLIDVLADAAAKAIRPPAR